MKIFEKRHIENVVGHWVEYYIFGKKVDKTCMSISI